MRSSNRSLRKVTRGLAFVLIACGIAEATLRFIPGVDFYLKENSLHCAASFYLRLCPSRSIEFKNSAGETYTVTTNEAGERITSALRDTSRQDSRTTQLELWLIGDSIAMGHGLTDSDTAAWIAQSRLKSWKVRNLATDSVGPLAMTDILKQTPGKPAQIIWIFNPSDFIDDPLETARRESFPRRAIFILKYYVRSSAIASAARIIAGSSDASYVQGGSSPLPDAADPIFAHILELSKEAGNHGARFCILLYSDVEAGANKPEKENRLRSMIADLALAHHICTIDVRGQFQSSKENLYLQNGHPGPAASRIFADAIVNSVSGQEPRAKSEQ
ncbi:MAG TPA: hypothetical protein PKE49_07060 [Leptospiraceae bacterium]|nr:hypothetical protein [Leptospirales bacterium]HMX56266.1 hypothetical protein [Leptospiraceae bacterium]HMZ37588.1 hypothetical protein [Leptospiraceae bacterium]HNE23720.1 hypothetical protein [Leptospiraceae bacterium]HNJ33811.1 hypothetical protein [Leptospiraceae bacterium]